MKLKSIHSYPNKVALLSLTFTSILITSCGDNTPKKSYTHQEKIKTSSKTNKHENELGQALDAKGTLLTGCPIHKEMIGVEGDQCPKCDYMTMLPITWPLQGVDTIRVKTLPDYRLSSDTL